MKHVKIDSEIFLRPIAHSELGFKIRKHFRRRYKFNLKIYVYIYILEKFKELMIKNAIYIKDEPYSFLLCENN
jgi:hypothetical protein